MASSASLRAFSAGNISAIQSVVGGAGASLLTGSVSVETEGGLEAGGAVAREDSTLCWAAEGTVGPSASRLIVEECESTAKATVK